MFLVFDIGGSKTRLAISKNLAKFSKPVIIDTPRKFSDAMAVFSQVAKEITGGKKIVKAAGGTPGPFIDKAKTKIRAVNLPLWRNQPLKQGLEKAFKTRVILENDSSVVGLGEAIFGPGKGHEIVAYLTISTGVGGGRIVNGKIDQNSIGFEPGNQIIDFKSNLKLENLISGKAVEKKYHRRPFEITDKKFWDQMAGFLAYGVNNSIVHWSPDIVILGGSMMKKIGIPVPAVEKKLEQILTAYEKLPKIKKAALGDFGGLYGGMALLQK